VPDATPLERRDERPRDQGGEEPDRHRDDERSHLTQRKHADEDEHEPADRGQRTVDEELRRPCGTPDGARAARVDSDAARVLVVCRTRHLNLSFRVLVAAGGSMPTGGR
jgi:hypothetical protein